MTVASGSHAAVVPHARIDAAAPERVAPHLSPVALAGSLWRNRRMLWQMSRTSVESSHREDVLGRLWLVIDPLILLGVYAFVFGLLFRATWGAAAAPDDQPRAPFVLFLYAGMLAYQVFSQSANLSTGLIRSSAGYVKQIVFPVEVIPASAVMATIVPVAIGAGLLVVANLMFGTGIAWTVLLLPVVLLPMFLLSLGVAWLFGALGVFVPDMRKVAGVLTQILFFLTPIVWPLEMFPKEWRWVVNLNPLTVLVEAARDVALRHQRPDWLAWGVVALVSAIVCQLGYAFFMKCRKAFADVL